MNRSILLRWGKDEIADGMLSSTICVSPTGELRRDVPGVDPAWQRVEFVKMRIVDNLPDHQPTLPGRHDLPDRDIASALYAWLLADTIVRAQSGILELDAARTAGRELRWSANVGIPVEHYDSPHATSFRTCAALAWHWILANNVPTDLSTLVTAYLADKGNVGGKVSDFDAVAELVAGIHSFVTDERPREGMYVFCDIGGGTVDVGAFNYSRRDGSPQIDVYSACVAPLGVEMIAAQASNGAPAELVQALLAQDPPRTIAREKLAPYVAPLQKAVAWSVMTAKTKDNRDWLSDGFQSGLYQRRRQSQRSPDDTWLPIFIGGGAHRSRWYRGTISSTHDRFGHRNANIPRYSLVDAPKPHALDMTSLPDEFFHRFAIAYGLSFEAGSGPLITLPSQNSPRDPLPQAAVPQDPTDDG